MNRPSGGGAPGRRDRVRRDPEQRWLDFDGDPRTRAPWAGGAPSAQVPAICRAACRPDRAAMSAVSAACTRFPAANTPPAEVASAVSTAGPLVPGSIASRAARARLWSGIQSAGEHEGFSTERSGSAPVLRYLHPAAARVPVDPADDVDVQTGIRQRTAAAAWNAA